MHEKPGKRILFVNEASASIGMGHILRSLTLARVMFSRGYSVSGIAIGDGKAVAYATERARREQVSYPILTMTDPETAVAYISIDQPSLVVVDCAKAGYEIVRACAQLGIPVLALDYFVSNLPLPDAVVNLIDHSPATLLGQQPFREGMIYREGPQYAIIRKEFMEARIRRTLRAERASVEKILIAFGGADPSGNTKRALEMIAQWPGAFVVDMIIGPLFKVDAASEGKTLSGKCVVRTHVSPDNIGQLFEDTDLVFCGGGRDIAGSAMRRHSRNCHRAEPRGITPCSIVGRARCLLAFERGALGIGEPRKKSSGMRHLRQSLCRWAGCRTNL